MGRFNAHEIRKYAKHAKGSALGDERVRVLEPCVKTRLQIGT